MEFFNSIPTWFFCLFLIAVMYLANEVGYRAGLRSRRQQTEDTKTASNAVKGAIFGLGALMLGFSFSMASSRFEERQHFVLQEANDLGTCYLRFDLIAEPNKTIGKNSIEKMVNLRLEIFEKGLDHDEVSRIAVAIDQEAKAVWSAIESTKQKDASSLISSQIVPAANSVIDNITNRNWLARKRLPGVILFLLAITLIVTALLIGHSSGQGELRQRGLWLALDILMSVVVFVIIDLDRPRQGLIQTDHGPLIELRNSFQPKQERNSP
jgi:hypothetical protein